MRKLLIALAALMAMALCAGYAAAESENIVYAKAIRINKKAATVTSLFGKPGTVKLSTVTSPAQQLLTNNRVLWSSGDESIATVDDTGLVTAVGEGKVKISASVKGPSRTLTVSCTVTVKAKRVSTVTLNETGMLFLDHTQSGERGAKLSATVKPETAAFQEVTWTSSDPSVAKVDKQGAVTAVGAGECTITASADKGRKSASIQVRVRDISSMIKITVSAAGDIVVGGDKSRGSYQRFRNFLKSGSGGLDYGYVLRNVKRVFEKDDITIVNVETTLTDKGNPTNPERTYNFGAPPEYANIFREGSVEVGNVINNHTNDYSNGLTLTKRALLNAGIALGDAKVGPNSTVQVKGVNVGFLGIQTSRGTSAGTVRKQVSAAKAKCDLLVVSFHFCSVKQYSQVVTAQQKALARAAINAGAGLVIGHHPHVYSGIEQYRGAYIFYDLGSLVMAGENGRHSTYITQTPILYDPKTGYSECLTPTVYPGFTSDPDYTEKDRRGKEVKRNNCQPVLYAKGSDQSNAIVEGIHRLSRNLPSPGKFNVG